MLYVFIGNPGTVKSTILNGFIGFNKAHFKAGPSVDGSGITWQLDVGKGRFMDTPGLADERMRTRAAAFITQALQQDGFYKIFFVMTLEDGRIRPDGKVTIRLVLNAAPIIHYSIILNKVPKKLTALQTRESKEKFITLLMDNMPCITTHITWNEEDEDLECETDVIHRLSDALLSFIEAASGMQINPRK